MTKKAAKIRIDDDAENPERWKDDEGRSERVVLTSDDELDEVLEGFPQNDACIELFRVNAQGGRPAFLEEMMPSAFSFGLITKSYGGGRYMAKGKYANGIKKKMFFEIEGDPIPVRRKYVNTDPQAPVMPMGPSSIATEALAPLKGEGGQDFQSAIMGMIGNLIKQSQQSEMAILEKMKIYKELFGSNAPPQKDAPLDQMLNMFQKGIELAGRGGGSEESFWLMAIREMKEPLLKIVETVQTAIAKPQPGKSGSPASVKPVEVVNGPQSVEDDPMLGLMPMIKQLLPMLVNGASKNTDPELYVGLILDQTPESAYSAFRDWLMKAGCLDQLALLEPGVRFQRDWWEGLRVHLIEDLTEAIRGDSNIQPQPHSDVATGTETDRDELA